jgi:serine/threonine-protein phosphatase 5
VTICGDIHGQFFDLLHIFKLNGYHSDQHYYVFNGDFVDRGSYSMEVVLTMLAFKCAYPRSFFMTRGNHESESVNRMHGFYEECRKKYGDIMFSMVNKVFNHLPLAYIVAEKIFVQSIPGVIIANILWEYRLCMEVCPKRLM